MARRDIDTPRSQMPRTLYERLEILPDLNDNTDGMRRMVENFYDSRYDDMGGCLCTWPLFMIPSICVPNVMMSTFGGGPSFSQTHVSFP